MVRSKKTQQAAVSLLLLLQQQHRSVTTVVRMVHYYVLFVIFFLLSTVSAFPLLKTNNYQYQTIQQQQQNHHQQNQQQRKHNHHYTVPTRLLLSSSGVNNRNNNNNNNDPGDDLPNGSSSSAGSGSASSNNKLVSMRDTVAQQLLSAFTSLDASDQYDAVLTGLCAKILDSSTSNNNNAAATDTTTSTTTTTTLLQDAINLLTEMNQRKISASTRSIMALIDATVGLGGNSNSNSDTSVQQIQTILSLAIKNGRIQQYGQGIPDIRSYPVRDTIKVQCPDGQYRTKMERLQQGENIPADQRQTEVSSVLAASTVVAACELTNLAPDQTFIHDSIAPEANILVAIGIFLAVIDNFYDFLKTSISIVVNLIISFINNSNNNKNKDNTTKSSDEVSKEQERRTSLLQFQDKITSMLPDKESLPGELGKGIYTGTLVRGFTRLLTVDTEREAQCEAAALYVAYTLGLPCFPYRPNSYEAYQLTISSNNPSDTSSLSTSSIYNANGILRMVIWLLSPVAMESLNYPQLIVSDPRECRTYLNSLRDYEQQQSSSNNNRVLQNDILVNDNNSKNDDNEQERFLQWAYLEALDIIQTNRNTIDIVAQRLIGGAATVGDCIAVIEQW